MRPVDEGGLNAGLQLLSMVLGRQVELRPERIGNLGDDASHVAVLE